MTTVLLVDSPRSVREALQVRLSLEPGLVIVGEADDATRATSLARALGPDVVLLDAEAAGLDASGLVRALTEHDLSSGIVVLTQHVVAVRRLPGRATGLFPLRSPVGDLRLPFVGPGA